MLGKVFGRYFSSQAGKRVGFIGLGNMGYPMVHNLIKNGYTVTAFDLNKVQLEKAEKVGAVIASDVKQATVDNDIVLTMLPNTEIVRSVREGKDGIFQNAKEGALIMDSSTIDPGDSKQMADYGESLGFMMADAPCSGGDMGARAGTLTFMLGCRNENLDYVKEFLMGMGNKIVHVGDPGKGHLSKICNNLCFAIQMISICEGLSLGEKLGIDPKVLSDIISTSTGSCFSLTHYNPVPGVLPEAPSTRDYEGGYSIALAEKDLRLALKFADTVNMALPFSRKALEHYEAEENQGVPATKDFSIMYKYVRSLKKNNEI